MRKSRLHPGSKQIVVHLTLLYTTIAGVISSVTDLFIPWRWSAGVINELLNASSVAERNRLADAFVSSTLSGLNNVGLTSGLVAGVISSAFSWTTIDGSHWLTKAFWYTGLVFAFASISSAGLCINALIRLRWHTDGGERVRAVLGYPVETTSALPVSISTSPTTGTDVEWKPRMFQPWIWGTPGMLLKFSLLDFLIGLGVDIWVSARLVGWDWESEQLKIAVFVTIAAGSAAVMYAVAVFCLFYRTVAY